MRTGILTAGRVPLLLLLLPAAARAMLGGGSLLSNGASDDFPLAAAGAAAPIVVAEADWPGVRRAAADLQADIAAVAGARPDLATAPVGPRAVLVGTLGRSALVDRLAAEGRIDAAAIRGRWEAFLIATVDQPLPGLERALVIAGSDLRGTIYGIYELSQQIGVSPWHWWADVPVPPRAELRIRSGRRVDPGPVVKYRGIFLNDEAPALTGWTREKFGGFNHRFYAKVFELLLRLRGNYLWPAMWRPQAFSDDDPENPRLADEYGIVMGTSHHEPLMRAHDEWGRYGQGPWDYARNGAALREFWRAGVARARDHESILTLGMRGDGDEAMSAEANLALLERIVADQRRIIAEATGREITAVPQLWALYKEVQEYYERGLRVPDDVTLLWCDDNWGNLRRLPAPEERGRPGGAGVYYHFDYVGGPRNYKWLNTVPLAKIQEQMHLAWRHEATRIWIVNVGDLKPMEFPIEFFLTMAWDPERWPAARLREFAERWAAREFGAAHAAEAAALVQGYARLNGRRKPEQLAPDTYSLVHYREAERVLAEWRGLVARAEALAARLPAGHGDAYFQLVLYPVQASANAQELYVAAGRNRLYARQGRVAANAAADQVRARFAEDARLAAAYHALGGGKWNHLMDQVKFGYTTWQQPELETMPPVQEVRPRRGAALAVALEGSEQSWPAYGAGRAELPALDFLARGTRWIEVFNRGEQPFSYRAVADQPWVRLAPAAGVVTQQVRIEVDVDWAAVPAGAAAAAIELRGDTGEAVTVHLPVLRPALPPGAAGFVESGGHVAIEAPHFSRAVAPGGVEWRVLPDFGRTLGAVTAFPVTLPAVTPGGGSPRLEYDVTLLAAGDVEIEWWLAPSLDFQPGPGLRFAASVDDAPPEVVRLGTGDTLAGWEQAVSDGVRRVVTRHRVDRPGRQVVKFWLVTPGVVLEKLVVHPRRAAPSYLGPPESPRLSCDP